MRNKGLYLSCPSQKKFSSPPCYPNNHPLGAWGQEWQVQMQLVSNFKLGSPYLCSSRLTPTLTGEKKQIVEEEKGAAQGPLGRQVQEYEAEMKDGWNCLKKWAQGRDGLHAQVCQFHCWNCMDFVLFSWFFPVHRLRFLGGPWNEVASPYKTFFSAFSRDLLLRELVGKAKVLDRLPLFPSCNESSFCFLSTSSLL